MDIHIYFSLLVNIAIPIALIAVGYMAGKLLEARHFKSIRRRETLFRLLPTLTLKTVPTEWTPERVGMISGNVVISQDYFKAVLATLKGIFGGRLSSYETLLDRARREAILRMQEEARLNGYNGIIRVRLETSTLASTSNPRGVAGVEIIAYGTGIFCPELAKQTQEQL